VSVRARTGWGGRLLRRTESDFFYCAHRKGSMPRAVVRLSISFSLLFPFLHTNQRKARTLQCSIPSLGRGILRHLNHNDRERFTVNLKLEPPADDRKSIRGISGQQLAPGGSAVAARAPRGAQHAHDGMRVITWGCVHDLGAASSPSRTLVPTQIGRHMAFGQPHIMHKCIT